MVLALCPLLLLAFSAVEWLLPPRAALLVPEERFSNESWTATARRLQGQLGGGFPQQPSSSGGGEGSLGSGFPSGNSGVPSGNSGGFPSGNSGGFPSGNSGGFPSGNSGGFPSGNSGGFPSGNSGGFGGGSSGGGGAADMENAYGKLLAFVLAYLLFVLIIVCGATIARVVFAVQYQNKVTNQRPLWPREGSQAYRMQNDFTFPLCGCLDDMQYCLHGFCCNECRFADTMQAAQIQQYWPMIFILYGIGVGIRFVSGILQTILQTILGAILGVSAVPGEDGKAQPVSGLAAVAFPFTSFLFGMIPLLLTGAAMAYFRGRLRERLSGGTEVPLTDLNRFFQDTLIWGCCGPCALIQEAREVDTATGLRVDCCCELKGGFGPMGAMQQPVVGGPVHVQGGMQSGMPMQGGMQSGNQQAFQQQQQQNFSGLRY